MFSYKHYSQSHGATKFRQPDYYHPSVASSTILPIRDENGAKTFQLFLGKMKKKRIKIWKRKWNFV
jgi:hypothetical protein